MELKDLVKKVLRYNKNADIDRIEKSYRFSEKHVGSKKRLSGDSWSKHYLDVAYLVADLKLDDNSIAAALMHGIIKRSEVTKKIITNEFGNEVTNLVEGISNINQLKKDITDREYDAEALRKVLLAASKDIRIIIIKLCDKLANMRELDNMPKDEQKRISQEVMDVYAPLAYRLGLGRIKNELEDLAFKYLEPGAYRDILNMIKKFHKDGDKKLEKTKRILNAEFHKSDLNVEIQSRVKHIYSVYKKIKEKPEYIGKFHDVLAIRIITNNIEDCYNAVRIVHNIFRPLQDLFKDYIAMPKPNGYQSIHTTVALESGSIMEVQIRTKEMHEISEEGIAAHFSYKGMKSSELFDKKLAWLKEIVKNKAFGSNIGIEFFSDQIYIFTPKGDMVELPADSTPIDFAYAIHSDLGNKCIGAKVNNKLVPLKTELNNGDVIEIMISKNKDPSMEWLKFVKTSRARNAIKHGLKENSKIPISVYSVQSEKKLTVEQGLIYVEGMKFPKIKFAQCCNPLPGENAEGLISGINKVTVHKSDCKNTKSNKKHIKCRWLELSNKEVSLVVDAEDKKGLFAEILNTVSSFGLNVTNAKGKSLGSNLAECQFTTKIQNLKQLNELIDRIKKIRNVKSIYLADNV